MSPSIHRSMTFAQWIEDLDSEAWFGWPIVIGFGAGIFPGGIALIALMHEPAWREAGADRPYSYLIAIPAWCFCLALLTLFAWTLATRGPGSRPAIAAATAATLAVGATAFLPAFLGTTGVLNGIGFVMITLLAQLAWTGCCLVLILVLLVANGESIDG